MIQTATAYTDLLDSAGAGRTLGARLREQLGGEGADAVVVFVSPRHAPGEVLEALKAASGAALVVGCSSAGEFVDGRHGVSAISALAFRSDELLFSASLGTGLRADRSAAARELLAGLRGRVTDFPHRTLLLLTDALAGHTDDLIEELNARSGGLYQIVGGGAGDDAAFRKTHVFLQGRSETDAAVALEILSRRPLGIGVQHGWQPAGELLRVTEAVGARLVSLNAMPAAEALEQYARGRGKAFDREAPLPFFLHNTLGIQTPDGFKLRVPLSVEPDGSLLCASDVPQGALVSVMSTSGASAAQAAASAVDRAVAQLQGARPQAALFFDCVATRLRLGDGFSRELASVEEALGRGVRYAGCNSYGQVARLSGQFSGFHNCTAVVCVVPE
jgi:hypothetical protein